MTGRRMKVTTAPGERPAGLGLSGLSVALIVAMAVGPATPAHAAGATPDVYPSRGALRLYHQRADCFPGDGNPKVVARVESLAPIVSAIVFFRSKTEKWEKEREERFRKKGLEKYEHYEEMRTGKNGVIWMVLPIPDIVTEEAVYRIVVRDAAGNEAATDDMTVPVVRDCDNELTEEERYQANNLVVGQTGDAQEEVPRGWRCRGIVSEIEKDGVLKPAGCPPAALWWGGAILAGSGVAVVTTGQQNPISPTRPQQGSNAPRGTP